MENHEAIGTSTQLDFKKNFIFHAMFALIGIFLLISAIFIICHFILKSKDPVEIKDKGIKKSVKGKILKGSKSIEIEMDQLA